MWTSWLPHLLGIVILALIAGTVVGVVRWHSRPLSPSRAIAEGLAGGLFVGLFLYFYAITTTRAAERSWMAYEVAFWENPSFPWRAIALAAVCTAAFCGCRPGVLRFQLSVILVGLLCGGLLITAYRAEIYWQHTPLRDAREFPVYTLKPELAVMVTRGRLRRVCNTLASLPTEYLDTRAKYPAGWLMKTAFWKALPEDYQEAYGSMTPYFSRKGLITTQMEWHTILTGFYRVREVPSAIWYPGGTYTDAIRKIEYRRTDSSRT